MVQGVGFRPFIYRLALKYGLTGEVRNTTGGVEIFIRSDQNSLKRFIEEIRRLSPAAAQIKRVSFSESEVGESLDFRIAGSDNTRTGITEISPDIAVCEECLADMVSQSHRISYPLINCTHCGPRFSIVKELPYDRDKTSMREFSMCETCAVEYQDVGDRRFHAQPVACNSCGPQYTCRSEDSAVTSVDHILEQVWLRIEQGGIVAVKGMGGYHLMCDALNNDAVSELRVRKGRDQKPFAVLFRDLLVVKAYCHVSASEEKMITSWRRPVVLLKQKKPLADAVNSGLQTTGAMLPYMPFHHLLFSGLKTGVVVLTSGNISDDPIITDDAQAGEILKSITPFIVSYNREICNRTDDSVVRFAGTHLLLIRRSRGYVPGPVDLHLNVEGILAMGAEQKNTFCIGKGSQAILSQHIGDLKGMETSRFYKDSLDSFFRMFRFKPRLLVSDLHPDYLSTLQAENMSEEMGIPLVRVQHHHAHIASCMAENHLDEKVIGISLDGTGLGTDGHIWGGEFLIADGSDFDRYAHFDYLPMPGGDKAVEEPWRMALAYLYKYPETRGLIDNIPAFRGVGDEKLALVREMIDKGINCPLTSGAGRLFDAVAAITGLCTKATFDAEPPMRLETVIADEVTEYYPFSSGPVISFAPMLEEIAEEVCSGAAISVISAKFHNTLVRVIAEVSGQIKAEYGISKVVLSGGVFQNSYLLSHAVSLLETLDFKVFVNQQVPVNDGGISLGQLFVAAKQA